VVFSHAKPQKSSYRKYKLTSVSTPDDYASMAEVLNRRFGKGVDSIPFPDLLMVDGGKGQLHIAVSVLQALDLENAFNIIGIAKKDEKKGEVADKVYQPSRADSINFTRNRDLLLFLQRIRDEAHRFAITFHRNRRRADSMESILDSVPGIGKHRKKMLLKHFGSIKKIRAATLEELSRLPGINDKTARSLKAKLTG
jgi:excinuclease ABC subunit C